MRLAAWCTQCGTYQWTNVDGTCTAGHDAAYQSGHYFADEASVPESATLTADVVPQPLTPLVPPAPVLQPSDAASGSSRGRVVLAVVLLLLAGLLLSAAVGFAIVLRARSGSSSPTQTAAQSRITSALYLRMDPIIAHEYPGYDVVDSLALAHDPISDLAGVRYLLKSKSGGFPKMLAVELMEGKLEDLSDEASVGYSNLNGLLTSDSVFSVSARKRNLLKDSDLVAIGREFDRLRPGPKALVEYCEYDTSDDLITMDVVATPPADLASVSFGYIDPTHIAHISQSLDEAGVWDPMTMSPMSGED